MLDDFSMRFADRLANAFRSMTPKEIDAEALRADTIRRGAVVDNAQREDAQARGRVCYEDKVYR